MVLQDSRNLAQVLNARQTRPLLRPARRSALRQTTNLVEDYIILIVMKVLSQGLYFSIDNTPFTSAGVLSMIFRIVGYDPGYDRRAVEFKVLLCASEGYVDTLDRLNHFQYVKKLVRLFVYCLL